MCGMGIIHHHDSEFHSPTIPIQFQTILTEIQPLILTKNDSYSNSHWSQSNDG